VKSARLVHEDLNACGGAEKLSLATIEALGSMGFSIDLLTFTLPNWRQISEKFGRTLPTKYIRNTLQTDIFSLLCGQLPGPKDEDYDLIINTHGDILPYNPDVSNRNKTITYCHFPVVPHLVGTEKYILYLKNLLRLSGISESAVGELSFQPLRDYNSMIEGTRIVTNSIFSKTAIRALYPSVNPTVVYPPVETKTFRSVLCSSTRTDTLIVFARYSPDKNIESAIRVAKYLKNKNFAFSLIIVGCISKDNWYYYDYIESLEKKYGLSDSVSLKTNVDIKELLHILGTSKVIFHPTIAEPFGISVAEAMSAGLVPIVPHIGGNSEFVPCDLHYKNENEAANKIKANMQSPPDRRISISNSVAKFDECHYVTGISQVAKGVIDPIQIKATAPYVSVVKPTRI
jgi:alpha-1,2-mannosyltransferase